MYQKRLDYLRLEMKKAGVEAYYLGTSDYHLCEYVPEYFRTIAWFTGFTGSAASLIVDYEDAYLFVDGRYHLQAEEQCAPYGIRIVKLGTTGALPPLAFLKKNYAGKAVGIDGRRTSVSFGKQLKKDKVRLVSVDCYSSLIEDRAPYPSSKAYELSLEYTGKSRAKKLKDLFYILSGRTHVLSSPEAICWLLNLRGDDIAHTPVFLSYMVFTKGEAYLIADLERFDEEILDHLYDDGIIIRPYDSFYDFLENIHDQDVLLDEERTNYETYSRLERRNHLYNFLSVVDEMKAMKNQTERENSQKAHVYDGVTMVRFIRWLKENDLSSYTEYDIAEKLDQMRRDYHAIDTSFGSIVGYEENSTVVHYAPTKEGSKKLENKGILLIDSGGHYLEGTTDITRTVSIGDVDPEVRKWFTLVLRGMLELSDVHFLYGTSGRSLDVLARKELWRQHVNYLHGTGHGVGYLLSVHEAPPSIRSGSNSLGREDMPLREGHIVSDEPGIYFNGRFGIRCENLLLVEKEDENEYGKFLHFHTLTLVPFDLDLIDRDYLSEENVRVLNAYHQRVYETLRPYLSDEEAEYLRHITRSIA